MLPGKETKIVKHCLNRFTRSFGTEHGFKPVKACSLILRKCRLDFWQISCLKSESKNQEKQISFVLFCVKYKYFDYKILMNNQNSLLGASLHKAAM